MMITIGKQRPSTAAAPDDDEALREAALAEQCGAIGCFRACETGRPVCAVHWHLLGDERRELLERLAGHWWPTAYQVALVLAIDWMDGRAPMWRKGWSEQQAPEPKRGWSAAAELATCRLVREVTHHRLGEQYARMTGGWRETLDRLGRLVGEPKRLEVALAMVRSGAGCEGFDPVLISAALDLDESRGLIRQELQPCPTPF